MVNLLNLLKLVFDILVGSFWVFWGIYLLQNHNCNFNTKAIKNYVWQSQPKPLLVKSSIFFHYLVRGNNKKDCNVMLEIGESSLHSLRNEQ